MYEVVYDARSVTARQSGIGRYAAQLLRHLVPLADDMRFVVLRAPGSGPPLVDHPRVTERHAAGETKSVRTVLGLGLSAGGFRGADLYHAPGDLVPLGLRCPWVVTMHDMMWIEAPALGSAFLPVRLANALWYGATYRQAMRGATRIIAISQSTATAIGRLFPAYAARTRVVHHGVDSGDAATAAPRDDLDRWVPRGCRYALIVGQGSPYKNHDGMVRAYLDAMAHTPDHRLVLVRRFSRVDRAMRSLLAEPRVRERVVVLPYASPALLAALYRHARMLLLVSHYEGFGLPALEAMAAGLPVLTSTHPALVEVTGEAALHASSRDHADMVRKLRLLEDDEALRQTLIEAGRRRAAQLTWPACAAATLAVYREALAAR